MTELDLLRVCMTRAGYEACHKYVKDGVSGEEARTILQDLAKYYDNPVASSVDWESFSVLFFTGYHPKIDPVKKILFDSIFVRLCAAGPLADPTPVIQHFVRLAYCGKIANEIVNITQFGKGSVEDIGELVDEYQSEHTLAVSPGGRKVTADMEQIVAGATRAKGLRWRLECLNRAVGPPARGDLIIVAGRPEAGKTTFVLSEVTSWLEQVNAKPTPEPRPRIRALVLNNEEAGERILYRACQSALNLNTSDMIYHAPALGVAFNETIGTDCLVVRDVSTIQECKRAIKEEQPDIIVVHLLDKMEGFEAKGGNNADRLRTLSQWLRTLASSGKLVIGIMQAGDLAENQKWVRMNMLYGSKTGVQGEADCLITIGVTHDPLEATKRFIHLPKNKLPGGPGTDPKERHGYFETELDADRARFTSV